MKDIKILQTIARRIRYNIVISTTAAGSGHPSSSLSSVELTSVLFFGGFFKQDTKDFGSLLNDKFVLSKGHAAPLLYSLYEAAGAITKEELLSLRKFESHLQGHPTPEFPFVDVTTGSLGQGLSVGVGMALGLKKKFQISDWKLKTPCVYVLLGDSEFAEGQNYEALQLASHYKLNNLIAILDVNRLGQRGETQLGWNTDTYKQRAEAFGWNVVQVENGNNIEDVQNAFLKLQTLHNERPTIIIAKTKKGAGISFMEDKDNWHGKPIPQAQLEQAMKDVGEVDFSIRGTIEKPGGTAPGVSPTRADSRVVGEHWRGNEPGQNLVSPISTREVYGHALADLAKQNENIIALDAETSNSTYAEFVKKETPEQFVECFIAEQNMVSMALGLSKVGFIPFASSFAAFLSRAFDQIRMSQYSRPTINIVGSHAGCSIGVDGASQMALEDISMMRSVRESTVLYPSDGVSAYKLTQEMAGHPGINYLRTTREKTPVLYDEKEEFPIGGLKIHHCHSHEHEDVGTYPIIISAGITLHEALKAQKTLEDKQIHTIVIDLYSIKPLDSQTLRELAQKTKHVVVVEDHYESGGIGEAVLHTLSTSSLKFDIKFSHLCVRKEPRSGTSEELMKYEEIDAEAIVKTIVG